MTFNTLKDNGLPSLEIRQATLRSLVIFLLAACSFGRANAQVDPCAINVGQPIHVCYNAGSFQMHGQLGSNVNPATVTWSTTSPGFSFTNPNDPQTTVTPAPPPNFPLGVVTFTISAKCYNGDPISNTIQITVDGLTATAQILANGLNVSDITVCTDVQLTYVTPPGAGQTGLWYKFFVNPDVTITGGGSSSFLHAHITPTNACHTYMFYYQITNEGCTSTDSVRVTFMGQDPDVHFDGLMDGQSYCLNGPLQVTGSAIGCQGIPSFEVIEYPGSSAPAISNYTDNTYHIYVFADITQSGWYTFVYHLDNQGGPCPPGTDTVRVFICYNPELLAGNIYDEYCGIPSQLTLTSPYSPSFQYTPWQWIPNPPASPAPTVTQVNPWTANVAINNPNVDAYTFTQKIIQDSCFNGKETFVCASTHVIRYYAQPDIHDTTVYILCGSVENFRPWDYMNHSFVASYELTVMGTSDPAHYPMGFSAQGINATFNLQNSGPYQFAMSVKRFQPNNCGDHAILTVIVCDESIEAGAVTDFCVGQSVQLVGSIPSCQGSQPLWREIDTNNPQLTFIDPATTTNPHIKATAPGHYCLEYSLSRTADCYLADTLCFDVKPCDTACLTVTVGEIRCFDNGTANPADDYWNFDIIVSGGPAGSYWDSGPPANEHGPYNSVKTIWPGSIAGSGTTYTLTIYDHFNPGCSATFSVPVPRPCSHPCEMVAKARPGPCNDNGTPILISDDYYYVDIQVTGTPCWMAKQKKADGTEVLLGTFTTNLPFSLGPFNVQDGDWTLWIFPCGQMDCVKDIFIKAPKFCSGCLDVTTANIHCNNNGTSNPNDDYWSFDILVNGGSAGSYWTATSPVNQSGPYGQWKTIQMGPINQYGSQIQFTVYDFKNPHCRTQLNLTVPRSCSDSCTMRTNARVGECIYEGEKQVYYVTLTVTGTNGGCWLAKQKFNNGTEIVLGTYTGDQSVLLGPFDPTQGNWTLWVMRCGLADCVQDYFIQVPRCDNGKARSTESTVQTPDYQWYPSPVVSELIIKDQRTPATPGAEKIGFLVLDMLGKPVYQSTQDASGEYHLNLENLTPGMYILQVQEQGKLHPLGRFVKN